MSIFGLYLLINAIWMFPLGLFLAISVTKRETWYDLKGVGIFFVIFSLIVFLVELPKI